MKLETLYKKLGLEYPFYIPPYMSKDFKIYPRESGRTTEMLVKALKRFLDGNKIIICVQYGNCGRELKNILSMWLEKLKIKKYVLDNIRCVVFDEFLEEIENNIKWINWENVFIDHACYKDYPTIKDYIENN
jgi:hypothetical protein